MIIDREKAIENLYDIFNHLRLPQVTEDRLYETIKCLDDERYGYHTWGGDEKEVELLRSHVRTDDMIDRNQDELLAVDQKYLFKPSENEKQTIDGYAGGYE